MTEKIQQIYKKYKDIIPYGIFGILTTAVNWGAYKLCYGVIGIPNVPATIISWILSVAFAFITNKLWVFNSKSFEKNILFKEAVSFVTARLLTGFLDVLIMWAAVDLMHFNADLWKLISNILVIVLNYIFSKLIIFKKRK